MSSSEALSSTIEGRRAVAIGAAVAAAAAIIVVAVKGL